MSSAGRAASLSGCVGRPRGHETGLTATPRKSNTLRPLAALSWKRPNIGSRMNREVHVRIWERPEVRVLRATRRLRSILYRAEIGRSGWRADIRFGSDLCRSGARVRLISVISSAADLPVD